MKNAKRCWRFFPVMIPPPRQHHHRCQLAPEFGDRNILADRDKREAKPFRVIQLSDINNDGRFQESHRDTEDRQPGDRFDELIFHHEKCLSFVVIIIDFNTRETHSQRSPPFR